MYMAMLEIPNYASKTKEPPPGRSSKAALNCGTPWAFHKCPYVPRFLQFSVQKINTKRTGLVVRASDSGSGDPGSILGRVGVLFP